MNITKKIIAEEISNKLSISTKKSHSILEKFISLIKTESKNKIIKISGFGNFEVKEKEERTGRNPQTGQEIKIAPRRVLTFKPSQVLKNALNAADAAPAPQA